MYFQGSNRDLGPSPGGDDAAPPASPTASVAPGSAVPSSASAAPVTPGQAAAASASSSTTGRPPFYRSRTDSLITYTPTTAAEAPGATFYIDRRGELDYVVLLKVGRFIHYSL